MFFSFSEHWSTRVESWEYPKDEKIEFASILVPNIDNVRITYLINILSKQEKSVLLIGESGTAKTVIIKSYLKHYNSEEHLTRIINFSSITTNNFIQKTIENFVDKRVANTFGPSFGRKMTIFIDDINMPMINYWGDQEANEIVRQLIEQKGFYSLTKPGDFLNIIDLQFLAAMSHPGGGRNDIPERLKRHFFILNCTFPSTNALDHIFNSIGKYFCIERNFSNDFINLVNKSISATRILWQIVKNKFLPTPSKFHYIFNLRDLSRIWEGILQINSEECQNNLEEYLQLWKHECTRILADRLVLNTEKEWFRKEQYKIAKQIFGEIYKIPIEEDSEVYFAK
jgi:dynein heavy chain